MSQLVLSAKQTQVVAVEVEAKKEEEGASTLLVGQALKRKEDPKLITGGGKYVDDIKLPEMLYSSVVRSSYAHARVKNIDVSQALNTKGVRLVYTAKTLPPQIQNSLSSAETTDGTSVVRPILAEDEATYVGEPLAFIVAEDRTVAEDAVESVKIEYEALEAVIDPDAALDDSPTSPRTRLGLKTNLAAVEKREFGNIESAFQKASRIVKLDVLNQRVSVIPIEMRSCIASYDKGNGSLTLWISTQGPFSVRRDISKVLNLQENKVRVIAPEVGGGFGAKLTLYSEEVLASLASIELQKPVKWIESRSENLASMTHGRGQNQHIEIAASDRGRILGLKARLIGDAGAYLTEGSSDATFTLRMIPGCYVTPAYYGEALVALTNKVPHDSYRGASRPEATFLIERAMDELARELGLDPVEVRLRNFVPKEDFPFKSAGDFEYDSGDYAMNLEKAVELSHYKEWRAEQKRAREQEGRIIGIGLATYVEVCAYGPSIPQTAAVSVNESGIVTITSGTSPHGQGHETPFAQIVADRLGIPIDQIYVTYGDTLQLPWATFTAGSRSAALGGSAVYMCAEKIRDKMAKIAANSLEISEGEIDFKDGEIFSKKDPGRKRLPFSKVASMAYEPEEIPKGMEPVLFAFSAFAPPNYTFPFGTHVAVVEIDRDTGMVKILDYTSVDDVGKVLNPMVVDGQIHGGVVQGVGQALLEQVKYDQDGQLLTASLLDYQIPLAGDVPMLHTFRTETPTDANPLGVKGVGEAGIIASTPAVANAVADALASFKVKLKEMPFTPTYIKHLLSSGGSVKT